MTYRGEVRDGTIVLDGNLRLPDGTRVLVQPFVRELREQAGDDLFEMGGLAVETGITDLATNVDHYLYGHPKVNHVG